MSNGMPRIGFMPALLAVAALSVGFAPATIEDEDRVRRAHERRDRERAQRLKEREARAEARRRENARRQQREADRIAQLQAGIDPTNGNPLSRQQRRRIQQKGLPR